MRGSDGGSSSRAPKVKAKARRKPKPRSLGNPVAAPKLGRAPAAPKPRVKASAKRIARSQERAYASQGKQVQRTARIHRARQAAGKPRPGEQRVLYRDTNRRTGKVRTRRVVLGNDRAEAYKRRVAIHDRVYRRTYDRLAKQTHGPLSATVLRLRRKNLHAQAHQAATVRTDRERARDMRDRDLGGASRAVNAAKFHSVVEGKARRVDAKLVGEARAGRERQGVAGELVKGAKPGAVRRALRGRRERERARIDRPYDNSLTDELKDLPGAALRELKDLRHLPAATPGLVKGAINVLDRSHGGKKGRKRAFEKEGDALVEGVKQSPPGLLARGKVTQAAESALRTPLSTTLTAAGGAGAATRGASIANQAAKVAAREGARGGKIKLRVVADKTRAAERAKRVRAAGRFTDADGREQVRVFRSYHGNPVIRKAQRRRDKARGDELTPGQARRAEKHRERRGVGARQAAAHVEEHAVEAGASRATQEAGRRAARHAHHREARVLGKGTVGKAHFRRKGWGARERKLRRHLLRLLQDNTLRPGRLAEDLDAHLLEARRRLDLKATPQRKANVALVGELRERFDELFDDDILAAAHERRAISVEQGQRGIAHTALDPKAERRRANVEPAVLRGEVEFRERGERFVPALGGGGHPDDIVRRESARMDLVDDMVGRDDPAVDAALADFERGAPDPDEGPRVSFEDPAQAPRGTLGAESGAVSERLRKLDDDIREWEAEAHNRRQPAFQRGMSDARIAKRIDVADRAVAALRAQKAKLERRLAKRQAHLAATGAREGTRGARIQRRLNERDKARDVELRRRENELHEQLTGTGGLEKAEAEVAEAVQAIERIGRNLEDADIEPPYGQAIVDYETQTGRTFPRGGQQPLWVATREGANYAHPRDVIHPVADRFAGSDVAAVRSRLLELQHATEGRAATRAEKTEIRLLQRAEREMRDFGPYQGRRRKMLAKFERQLADAEKRLGRIQGARDRVDVDALRAELDAVRAERAALGRPEAVSLRARIAQRARQDIAAEHAGTAMHGERGAPTAPLEGDLAALAKPRPARAAAPRPATPKEAPRTAGRGRVKREVAANPRIVRQLAAAAARRGDDDLARELVAEAAKLEGKRAAASDVPGPTAARTQAAKPGGRPAAKVDQATRRGAGGLPAHPRQASPTPRPEAQAAPAQVPTPRGPRANTASSAIARQRARRGTPMSQRSGNAVAPAPAPTSAAAAPASSKPSIARTAEQPGFYHRVGGERANLDELDEGFYTPTEYELPDHPDQRLGTRGPDERFTGEQMWDEDFGDVDPADRQLRKERAIQGQAMRRAILERAVGDDGGVFATAAKAQRKQRQLNAKKGPRWVVREVGALGETKLASGVARSGDGGFVVLPKSVARAWDASTPPTHAVSRAVRAANRRFVRAVLPFSASWHFGNAVDLMTRLAVAGYRPGDGDLRNFLRVELDKDGDWARLVLDAVGGAGFRSENTLRIGRQIPVLDKAADYLLDQQRRVEGSAATKAQGTVARSLMRDLGIDSHVELAKRLKARPELVDEFHRRTLEIVGDYVTHPMAGKVDLRTAIPFVQWLRASARFTFDTLPRKHPVKTALILQAAAMSEPLRRQLGFSDRVSDEQIERLGLPQRKAGFLAGAIPMPGGELLPTSNLHSFGAALGAVADPLEVGAGALVPWAAKPTARAAGYRTVKAAVKGEAGRAGLGESDKTSGPKGVTAADAGEELARAFVPGYGVAGRMAREGRRPGRHTTLPASVADAVAPRDGKRRDGATGRAKGFIRPAVFGSNDVTRDYPTPPPRIREAGPLGRYQSIEGLDGRRYVWDLIRDAPAEDMTVRRGKIVRR